MQRVPLILISFILFISATAQKIDSARLSQLHFRFIGPDGNRVIAVVGEPGNPMVSYAGAASGGIFKTEDGGINWRPIFDQQDNSSIGALAIAPAKHSQIWAGTGETFLIRPAHAIGNGVYKSTDTGKTWRNVGLQKTARISRIIVDPNDTNVVYVGALGNTHIPQEERGVFKTTDGGKNWQRILFVNENTGCSDMTIDPQHPNIIFAAMWQVEIKTWKLNSGGPGSGIYKSSDFGKTWKQLTNGLPGGKDHPLGKTSVDLAYSNPKIVYALVEDKTPALYRSEDEGESWKLVNQNNSMAQRAPYYTRVRVSTEDENKLYTICVSIMESKDGGKTFNGNGNYRAGGDNHDMWFDPTNSKRMMVGHDGCLSLSYNGGHSWQEINLPVAQMYHVAVDNQVPYNVYGNRQDGYSYKGPSNSLQAGIPLGLWQNVGGCESGFAQPDPVDNNIVWSGCYDGGLDVLNVKTGNVRDVRAWPEAAYGWAPADVRFRWHWNFPMIISVHDHNKVLIGSQFLHQTTNGGQSWQLISPDLTTNDKSHQQNSGGIAIDNLMTFDGCTLFSIAESPLKEGVIWTGSNDGQVQLTKDGGKSWSNVTSNIIGLPKWGTISSIEPSAFDVATVYVSVDLHQQGNFDPYIYKSADFGNSWQLISTSIPKINSSFVHQVKEDPVKKELLWAGTDNALFFTVDGGINWNQIKNDLPPSPIYGITIQKNFNDLVLATFGRGFYILDDIKLFRELNEENLAAPAVLFSLNKAYRFQDKPGIHSERSFVTGENPKYGLAINYLIKEKSNDTAFITIKNSQGEIVRNIIGTNKPGVNRIWWNLAYNDLVVPSLRTRPRNNDWVKLDAVGKRNMYIWDLDMEAGVHAPLVPPGVYTIQLKYGNHIFIQKAEIFKDPNTTATDAEIIKQNNFGVKLYGTIKKCFTMVDEMENLRSRLLYITDSAKTTPKRKMDAAKLENELWVIEGRVHDIFQTGAREDIFRNPAKLLEKFLAVAKESSFGSSDFQPTDQDNIVYDQLSKEFDDVQNSYNRFRKNIKPAQIELKLKTKLINKEDKK